MWLRNYPHFIKHECSSQELTTCPYPEPYNPQYTIAHITALSTILIISSHLYQALATAPFPSVFLTTSICHQPALFNDPYNSGTVESCRYCWNLVLRVQTWTLMISFGCSCVTLTAPSFTSMSLMLRVMFCAASRHFSLIHTSPDTVKLSSTMKGTNWILRVQSHDYGTGRYCGTT